MCIRLTPKLLGSGNGVGLLVDPVELLERTTLGLDTEEPPAQSLDEVPEDEEHDVVVANVGEGDRPGKEVDEAHGLRGNVAEGKTLGTHAGGEVLDSDGSLERGVDESAKDAKEDVDSDGTLTDSSVDRLVLVDGLLDDRGEGDEDGEGDGEDTCTERKDVATLHAVGEDGTGQSSNNGECRVHEVVAELGSDRSDTNLLKDDSGKVGETVTRELQYSQHAFATEIPGCSRRRKRWRLAAEAGAIFCGGHRFNTCHN